MHILITKNEKSFLLLSKFSKKKSFVKKKIPYHFKKLHVVLYQEFQ